METTVKTFPQQCGKSPVTSHLIDILSKGQTDDILDDTWLCEEVNADVSVKGRHSGNLYTAMRYVEREYGVVWQRLHRQQKIKCLNSSERIQTGKSRIVKIRKIAKRTTRIIASTDHSTLTDQERVLAGTQLAQLGAIRMFADKPNSKTLALAQNNFEQLAIEGVMKKQEREKI